MKTEYKKLLKIADQIMINSLFKSGGTKTEIQAIKEAILIHEPKKYKNNGFELCFLNSGKTENDFCNISIFLNSYNELIFSYGSNHYGKMHFQHKMQRQEEKTILLLDYVFKNSKCENFKNRVLFYIRNNETQNVKDKFNLLINK